MFALNWRRVIPSPRSEAVFEELTYGDKRQPVGRVRGARESGWSYLPSKRAAGLPLLRSSCARRLNARRRSISGLSRSPCQVATRSASR